MNTKTKAIFPIDGVSLGSAAAGIKYVNRDDLVVINIVAGATSAAVFTKNAFCAAPVEIARAHIAATSPRAALINSGNANAGTGAEGRSAATICCEALAAELDCEADQVLPFSTGVIGESLPVDRILKAIPAAVTNARADGWQQAAAAIKTTDTVEKIASAEYPVGNSTIRVTGIAKGAGMIRPDMATLLAYVATDATVDAGVLQNCLVQAVTTTFNRITIDGDTSTNDSLLLIATGANESVVVNSTDGEAYADLLAAVTDCCSQLALAIVSDAEGGTKVVKIMVNGGQTEDECLKVGWTVAESPLVKTALFASDPNWGRILAAVGRAGLGELDVGGVDIWIGDVRIVEKGARYAAYTEAQGQNAMAPKDITIRIELSRGDATASVWTSDLSYDYVKINAEYRT